VERKPVERSRSWRPYAQKLREGKATLEGMVQCCDELIMEITDEIGLNHMSEHTDDEDDDNREMPPDPLLLRHPLFLCHLLPHLRRSSSKRKTMWRCFPSRRPLRHKRLSWLMQILNHQSPTSTVCP
jgi:hypothetical protein